MVSGFVNRRRFHAQFHRRGSLKMVVQGLGNTLFITFFAVLIGIAIGIVVATVRST